MKIFTAIDFSPLPAVNADDMTVGKIMTLVFGILGAVALIIILLASFKYIVSQGEPQATNKAKNTIMYAAIGLAVIVFAQALVVFVLNRL